MIDAARFKTIETLKNGSTVTARESPADC